MDHRLFKTLLVFSTVLLCAWLLFLVLEPFLALIVWAAAIGNVSYPLYQRLLVRCRGRESLCAAVMTSCIALALVLPLVGLIISLSDEAAQTSHYLERFTSPPSGAALADLLTHPALSPWLQQVRPLVESFDLELDTLLLPAFKQGATLMLNYATGIVKDLFWFLFKLLLFLITLFFVYKDGASFLRHCWRIMTVNEKLQQALSDAATRVLRAVFYGVILACIVQGFLGGLGFWAAGLPSPFLFGALMAICAPIPLVGTALIWLPGATYLLMQGQTLAGLLLLLWGVLVVSSIDNILRPIFISSNASLPILLIVFGVLGGLLAFGPSGIVAGPLILAIILVLLDAYRGGQLVQDGT